MRLAGADHITISPPLLRKLASTTYVDTKYLSLFDTGKANQVDDVEFGDVENEERFRMAFTRRDGGKQEKKLVEAINIFCDFQEKLEKMMLDVGRG